MGELISFCGDDGMRQSRSGTPASKKWTSVEACLSDIEDVAQTFCSMQA